MKSKKVISLVLASILSLGALTGCGKDSSSSSSSSSQESSSSSSLEDKTEASSNDESNNSSTGSEEVQELQEVTEDETEKDVDVKYLDKEVPLTNNSGEKVKELRISPASKEKWGDNLLTKELENGETIKIHFKGDTPTNYWDIKMVDVNGKETVWATVEIFKSLDINLTMDQGMPSSECTQEPEK